MDILVTGAGVCGGYLMTRLMTAFKKYRHRGLKPEEIFNLDSRDFFLGYCKENIVRKANRTFVLSGCPSEWEDYQAQLLRRMKNSGHVAIVHIRRNRKDVFYNGRVIDHIASKAVRKIWVASEEQYNKYKDIPNVLVKYEELCKQPDVIQQTIVEALNLEFKYLFSEYPSFVIPEYTHCVKRSQKLRPIDTKSIDKHRHDT